MNDTNCITGNLWPYVPIPEKPWNPQRVQHLFRRIGYGASRTELEEALVRDPQELVEELLTQAANSGIMTPPSWADWTIVDYYQGQQLNFELNFQHFAELVLQWIRDMIDNPIREKMTLFWTNHFVTEFEAYECTPAAYRYHKLIQTHAFGNFRDFVRAIGLSPAMLLYLNGNENTVEEPNENYARELYELFTLGRDIGYTQQDIVETARALTGWKTPDCANVVFAQQEADPGEKTIFGRTGNWGYDEVIDILFEEKAELIARHICAKLYRFFVYETPNEEVVDELVQTMLDNDFELMPVLRLLFKSEHFFSDEVIGTRVKSPMDILISFIREMHLPVDSNPNFAGYIFELGEVFGQTLFSPVDVAGWPGYHNWIDNSRLTARWEALQNFSYFLIDQDGDNLMNWVRELTDTSNDPGLVTVRIVDYLLPRGLQTPEAYERATIVFKADIPENYFQNGIWNLYWPEAVYQVAVLLIHLVRSPEFQLT